MTLELAERSKRPGYSPNALQPSVGDREYVYYADMAKAQRLEAEAAAHAELKSRSIRARKTHIGGWDEMDEETTVDEDDDGRG